MADSGRCPTIEELVHGEDGDGGTFTTHRSLRSLIKPITYLTLTVFALYLFEYGVALALGSGWRGMVPILGEFSFRWFSLLPLGILLEIVRTYNDDLYVLERERIVHHSGLFSLTYHVPSISYYDIRAVEVKQGVIGRILNFGDIELSTAAQDRSELTITGIHAPLAFARLINDMRSWQHGTARETRRHHAPTPTRTSEHTTVRAELH